MNTTVESHARVSPVGIGKRSVGDGETVYVIAEAGVNHDGSVETALRMVEVAAELGADAVKFQMFTASELATSTSPTANYQRAGGGPATQVELLRPLELSDRDFAAITDRCRSGGIDFLATPFAVADLGRLDDLAPSAIKLASTDLDNVPLQEAAAETGLPLIVSTGAADELEVAAAVGRLDRLGALDRVILLHCVSSYPTRWADANLRAIVTLRNRFDRPSGYSDHTTALETGALAVAAGACVVEKHFTLDRRSSGPDHAMSLEPNELGRYIQAIRRAETALGSGLLACSPAEVEVRMVSRRSVVARIPIEAGTVLTGSMLAAKRPGGGLEPAAIEQLIGRRLRSSLALDQRVRWDMVE